MLAIDTFGIFQSIIGFCLQIPVVNYWWPLFPDSMSKDPWSPGALALHLRSFTHNKHPCGGQVNDSCVAQSACAYAQAPKHALSSLCLRSLTAP